MSVVPKEVKKALNIARHMAEHADEKREEFAEGGAVKEKKKAEDNPQDIALREKLKAGLLEGPKMLITTKNLARAFDEAISQHLKLSPEERIKNSKRAEQELAKYLGTNKNGQVKDLLGKNGKLMKSEKGYKGGEPVTLPDGRGIETTGLALAPAFKYGNFDTCPNHASCWKECLGKTSGNYYKLGGGPDLDAFKGPRLRSLMKTLAFFHDPYNFAIKLHDEIQSAKEDAADNGNHFGMRLNVLSDIHPRVHQAIIKAHPDVSFYDYTKNNTNPIADNHHYTYSSTGLSQDGPSGTVHNENQNWDRSRKRLDGGDNVAMAFSHKRHLPTHVYDEESKKTYRVIDGDTHDFRPLDKQPKGSPGVIVGLRNKKTQGKMNEAYKDSNGFFVHYDPKEKMTHKGTFERDARGQTIPTNRMVSVKPQGQSAPAVTNDSDVAQVHQ